MAATRRATRPATRPASFPSSRPRIKSGGDPYLALNPSFMFNGVALNDGTFSGSVLTGRQYSGVYGGTISNQMCLDGGSILGGVAWVDDQGDDHQTPIVPSTLTDVDTYDDGFTTVTGTTQLKRYSQETPLLNPAYLCNPARQNLLNPSNGLSWSKHPSVGVTMGTADIYDGLGGATYTFSAGASAAAHADGGIYRSVARTAAQAANGSVFVRGVSGQQIYFYLSTNILTTGDRKLVTFTGDWQRVDIGNMAAATATCYMILATHDYTGMGAGAPLPGVVVEVSQTDFWVGSIVMAAPIPYTTARAAQILTYPTAGRIRNNNCAFRCIFVPTADNTSANSASPIIIQSYTNTSNYLRISCIDNVVVWVSRVDGTSTYITTSTGGNIAAGAAYDVIAIKTSDYGMHLSCRKFSAGAWGVWMDCPAPNTAAAGRANAALSSTVQIGQGVFVGKVNIVEHVLLPLGLTDPLAWAKTKFGV